jgi:hypothetical protein
VYPCLPIGQVAQLPVPRLIGSVMERPHSIDAFGNGWTTCMLDEDEKHFCRVCGRYEVDPPFGQDNQTALFDICACCGATHGYEDILPQAARAFRAKWMARGASWFEPKLKPDNWVLQEQLKSIPEDYK